jgi:hypothetical protein
VHLEIDRFIEGSFFSIAQNLLYFEGKFVDEVVFFVYLSSVDAKEGDDRTREKGEEPVVLFRGLLLVGDFLKVVLPSIFHIVLAPSPHKFNVAAYGSHIPSFYANGISGFFEVGVCELIVCGDVEAEIAVEFIVDNFFCFGESEGQPGRGLSGCATDEVIGIFFNGLHDAFYYNV